MRIIVGSDHAGFRLKGAVIEHLAGAGDDIEDVSTFFEDQVDDPPICAGVVRFEEITAIEDEEAAKGRMSTGR